MALGGSTGYAINPARDLGPRIAHSILPIKGKGDSSGNMLGYNSWSNYRSSLRCYVMHCLSICSVN